MKTKAICHLFAAAILFITVPSSLLAQAGSASSENPTYKLTRLDLVSLSVFGESDINTRQRIDGAGRIRIPLVGPYQITGKTVREAEEAIEQLYITEQLFRNPLVTLSVEEYSPKEVSVLGDVQSPGLIAFQIEVNSMDIVEVISRAGGFTQIARANRVQVTRTNAEGMEETFEIDVDRMIKGGRRGRGEQNTFLIQPGDIIFVPQSLF